MHAEQYRDLSIQLATLIAREALYLEYSPEEVRAAEMGLSAQEKDKLRQRGFLTDDFEKYYVIDRFCRQLGVYEAADEPYLRALFSQAKRYTRAEFYADPYLQQIEVRDACIGKFLLMNAEYDRGEFFQYDMPELESGIVVPKLAFCSEKVHFPSVYEGNMPWVSVCPSEIRSMQREIPAAHGRVLVLGLGLGYYPFRIAQSSQVRQIVIVERQEEIIELFRRYLLPQFPHSDKISIVKADAYDYMDTVPPGKFDFCFADLWEGQQDGAEAYQRLRAYETKLPDMEFTYWIKKEIQEYIQENEDFTDEI